MSLCFWQEFPSFSGESEGFTDLLGFKFEKECADGAQQHCELGCYSTGCDTHLADETDLKLVLVVIRELCVD